MNTVNLQNLDIQSLLAQIPGYPLCLVAYSGGADSTALLHILCRQRQQLSAPLKAVHVDHQLHAHSGEWAKHCRKQCDALDVELQVLTVDASPPRGESPEAWARKVRYESICRLMNADDILFTAHNKDDQAETLLLQLLRGAGPEGMASMPAVRQMQCGWLVRPLLPFSKEQLREYNRQHDLDWIEDTSNQETGMDRNYLRQVIMPALLKRWPGVLDTLSRSAGHQAELMQIAREVAEKDAGEAVPDVDRKILDIGKLQALSVPRQKNLLRYWIKSNRFPLPGRHIIYRVLSEVVPARPDALPGVQWDDTEIRRFRDRLYIMKKLPVIDNSISLQWNLNQDMNLPYGRLQATRCTGEGISDSRTDNHIVTVAYRQGGESIRLRGRKHKQDLKKLFQDADIPVWQRDRLPLIYINGSLAAVADYWIARDFQADNGEYGWKISFQPD